MSAPPQQPLPTDPGHSSLRRNLSRRQLTMIVIGGAIGTGLFLGSGIAIQFGGPAVILAYIVSAALALMISWALAEMAVVHPSAGSMGAFASRYVSHWVGYMTIASYWAAAVISIGQEIVAASIYCRFWLTGIPQWFWVALFASMLVWINTWKVGRFGEFEYWFSLIKVITIILFIVLGSAFLLGFSSQSSPGLANYTQAGGFLPHGIQGLWFAVPFALISFIGIELISITSGEVTNPAEDIPKASRTVVWRLILFYVAAMGILLAVAPWHEIGTKISPFVFVFQVSGLPATPSVMNFVVLTAALSGANAALYAATRMLYSMAGAGLAPAVFHRVSARGVPVPALLGSATGLAAAIVAAVLIPAQAFMVMIGAAYFQIMFVWIAILVSYMGFRRSGARQLKLLRGHPYTTVLAITCLVGILLTTWWIPAMRVTAFSGAAWLLLASSYYFMVRRRRVVAGAKSISAGPA